jgi:hypothetical protein
VGEGESRKQLNLWRLLPSLRKQHLLLRKYNLNHPQKKLLLRRGQGEVDAGIHTRKLLHKNLWNSRIWQPRR